MHFFTFYECSGLHSTVVLAREAHQASELDVCSGSNRTLLEKLAYDMSYRFNHAQDRAVGPDFPRPQ